MLNLGGMVFPSLIALLAIPLCVRVYGDEQFGLLSLAWTFIVSFAYLNLGMGISSTKYAAELLRDNAQEKLAGLVWSALGINFVVGLFFSVLLFFTAPWITDSFIQPSPDLRDATVELFMYTGFSIPFITMSLSLKGVLDASNRFVLANSIKVPSTSLLFIIPLLGALFSFSISTVVMLLALSRAAIALAFFITVVRLYPVVLRGYAFDAVQVKTLFRFGGWVSISSFLNPIITQGEKVLIPVLLTVGTLTYYSAPHEMVARITMIPASLSVAILPKFSYLGMQDTRELREQILLRPLKYLLFAMTPVAAVVIFFSNEITAFLLGSGINSTSGEVLIVLTAAYFCSSLAALPFSAINGLGHPELKAKWDLLLAPLFVLAAFFLIRPYGIVGAAVSKFLALSLDMVCLFWMLKNLLKLSLEEYFPKQVRIIGTVSMLVLLAGGAASWMDQSLLLRVLLFGFIMTAYFFLIWMKWMTIEEQNQWKRYVPLLSGSETTHIPSQDEQRI